MRGIDIGTKLALNPRLARDDIDRAAKYSAEQRPCGPRSTLFDIAAVQHRADGAADRYHPRTILAGIIGDNEVKLADTTNKEIGIRGAFWSGC